LEAAFDPEAAAEDTTDEAEEALPDAAADTIDEAEEALLEAGAWI